MAKTEMRKEWESKQAVVGAKQGESQSSPSGSNSNK